MKKKMLLATVGGAAAGIALIAAINEFSYAAGKWISKRIRNEIDDYEGEKELDAEIRAYEEEEERQDLFFSEDLDDEFELDFILDKDILSEPLGEKDVKPEKITLTKDDVLASFVWLVDRCWIAECIHDELDVAARQALIEKELRPIANKLYKKVTEEMIMQNEAVVEQYSCQKSFGKNMIGDVPACRVMYLQRGGNHDGYPISVLVSHELWLTDEGCFILIDSVLEGNDDKVYGFYVYMGEVDENYNLNLSGDELMDKIKSFAEHGCD